MLSELAAEGAFIELSADDSKLRRGLTIAAARLRAWGAGITQVGRSIFATGSLLTTPFVLATAAFTRLGSEMADAASRTGTSVENLSELAFAAQQGGAGLEDIETALKKMSKHGMGADDFEKVADQLAALPPGAARTKRAMELMGKSGTKLLPMLENGAAGLRALRDEARRAGLVMSTEDAMAADAFGDALGKLWAQAKMTAFQVGAALAPTLIEVVKWLSSAAGATIAFVKENRGLVVLAASAAVGILALGAALITLGPVLSFAGSAALFFSSPLGLVVAILAAAAVWTALVAGALALVAWKTGLAAEAFKLLSPILAPLLADFLAIWGGIMDALSTGDLAGAANIAWLALKLAWVTGTSFLMNVWDDFLQTFQMGFDAIILGIVTAFGRGIGLIAGQLRAFVISNATILDKVFGKGFAVSAARNLGLAQFVGQRFPELLGEEFKARQQKDQEAIDARKREREGDELGARHELENAIEAARLNKLALAQGIKPPIAPLGTLQASGGAFNPFAAARLTGDVTPILQRQLQVQEDMAEDIAEIRKEGGGVFG